MSVTIRLAKFGKRNAPSYRVVVANTRDKRNGKFLDTLGFFNPSDKTTKFTVDKKKYEEWKAKGALVTKAVEKLIDGTYEYIKYEPKKQEKKPRENGQPQEKKTDEPNEGGKETPSEEPQKEQSEGAKE